MLPQPRIRLLHALNQILRGLVERIRVLIPPFADDHAVRHSARRNACSRPNGDSIRILAAHWFPVVRICNAYRPLPELPEIAARPHVLVADVRDFRLSGLVAAGHIPHARRHRPILPVLSRPGSLL